MTIPTRPSDRPRSRRRRYLPLLLPTAAWGLAAAAAEFVRLAWPSGPVPAWLTTHLLLLGAVTAAILTWGQHFTDSLTRRSPPRGTLGARLAAHSLAAALVVVGVVLGADAVVLAGGALLAVIAVAHGLLLLRQLRGALAGRFTRLVAFYAAAAAFLVPGVTAGVLLATGAVPAGAREGFTTAHLVLNLGGWVGLTAVGTLVLLWPTVLHAKIAADRPAAPPWVLPVLCGSVLLAAAGALLGLPAVVAAGVAGYLVGFAPVLVVGWRQARSAAPGSHAAWSMAAAAFWFVGTLCAFGILETIPSARIDVLLVPFGLGFAAQLVVGALGRLLPAVLGGGPAGSRALTTRLDRHGAFRVTVLNGALLVLTVTPVPAGVEAILLAVAVAVLLLPLPLAIRGTLEARRARLDTTRRPVRDEPAALRLHRNGGGILAAVGTLVVACALGASFLAPAPPDAGHAHTGTVTVRVTMRNMRFSPATIRVPRGDSLRIRVTNRDPMVHDLTLENGRATPRLVQGRRAVLDAGVVTKDLDGWCSVPGHRRAGMVLKIIATDGATTEHPDGKRGSHAEASGPSAARDVRPGASPPEGFTARDPRLPAAEGPVHHVTLTVRDRRLPVAPGVTQTLWTYDGEAPGPILHGHVGDRFEVTLVNHGDMGHSVDFHAGSLAPDLPMRTIAPGESLTYDFTAKRSGIWLYHCATEPMALHVANGMFGAIVIDPPGLDKVDEEYVLVQNGYYLGPQGGSADPRRLAAERPDLLTFNGYADQYRARPLTAAAGDRVRIWVLDAGPNRPTSFHVVGAQFDTVFKEGAYRLRRGGPDGTGGSQALDLQPAQGGFVEFTLPEAGNYPFLTHILSDAALGARGTIHVGD